MKATKEIIELYTEQYDFLDNMTEGNFIVVSWLEYPEPEINDIEIAKGLYHITCDAPSVFVEELFLLFNACEEMNAWKLFVSKKVEGLNPVWQRFIHIGCGSIIELERFTGEK